MSVRGASTSTDSKRESDVFSRLRSFSELTEAEIDASNDSVRGLTKSTESTEISPKIDVSVFDEIGIIFRSEPKKSVTLAFCRRSGESSSNRLTIGRKRLISRTFSGVWVNEKNSQKLKKIIKRNFLGVRVNTECVKRNSLIVSPNCS